jgi:hypothetical protein
MLKKEQFLLKREISRLLNDYQNCTEPLYKELVRKDVLFLSSVLWELKENL